MDNDLNLNIFNCIMLTGIIQGFVFAAVVAATKRYRSFATTVLTAFILSFSLDNFQFFLEDAGIISEPDLMSRYFIPFQFLSAPLFLLYGKALLNSQQHFRSRDTYLFLPFLIALFVSGIYKVMAATGMQEAALSLFFSRMEIVFELTSIAFDVTVLIYLIYKFNKINTDTRKLLWFRYVLILLAFLTLVWIAATVADFYFANEYWYAVYIGMAVVIYWMGHIGIYHYGAEQKTRKKQPDIQRFDPNSHIAALQKIVIDEKQYLNPNLTLDLIASKLQLSKSHLSRLINAELEMSFPEFLNTLRVDEAKIYLSNPDYSNYTLVAIGLEAGFNSKTAFNTAFKKCTSQTPSEFRKTVLKNAENV